jgi:glutathione peroxidase
MVILMPDPSATAQSTAPSQPLVWAREPLPTLEGGLLAPADLEGKVVLMVNTASFCGYTPQYKGLARLWQDYRGRGLVVLGVPSNDFGAQEPGSDSEIKGFCELTYGVDFPMLSKQDVIGPQAHPLYLWAAAAGGPAAVPQWNFHKILIGRDGRFIAAFPSAVEPTDATLIKAIEAALATKG